MKKMKRCLILVMAVMSAGVCQSATPATSPPLVRFEVSATAISDPALRYQLTVPPPERVPGDAAPFYLAAMLEIPQTVKMPDGKSRDLDDLVDQYLDMPLGELKKSDAPVYLRGGSVSDRFLEFGSKRTRAEWPNNMREDGISALLPYLNHIRAAARYSIVGARVNLLEGDFAGAIAKHRALLTMAGHLQEDGVVVQDLVGIGIAQLALEHLREVLEQPGSPNLYWALASLPRPMFDMGKAIGWEKTLVRASLRPLRGGRRMEELSGAEWTQVVLDFSRMLTSLPNQSQQETTVAALAIPFYPKAKEALISQGRPADVVKAMPVAQVIGLSLISTFDHWDDEFAKWAAVPYPQAARGIEETTKAFEEAKAANPMNPAFLLIPALGRAYATSVQLDRHIAALQTVEGLRGYAANHEGKLPASLDELAGDHLPAPLDPTTGKAFGYQVHEDATADLTSPAGSDAGTLPGLHYVIVIRQK